MADVQITRAWSRARRLYTSQQFQTAYVRGASAALKGQPIDVCPYRSRGGWRAWRTAWTRGFRSVTP